MFEKNNVVRPGPISIGPILTLGRVGGRGGSPDFPRHYKSNPKRRTTLQEADV